MKYKKSNIQEIMDRNNLKINAPLIKEMTDSGFLKYKKLTEKNYDYWWCEVPNIKETKINKKNYTFSYDDFEETRKYILLELLLPYYSDKCGAYNIITNVLEFNDYLEDGRIDLISEWFKDHTIKGSKQLSMLF